MFTQVYGECCQQFSIHVLISGFLLDWNERGWIVIHQGNLTSDYQIFFLLTFEEITDVFFVFNSMYRQDGSIDRLMFTMKTA